MNAKEQGESIERRKKNLENNRWNFKRLIDTNFYCSIYKYNSCFITLTYNKQVEDIEIANKDYKDFILRLNYYLKKHNNYYKNRNINYLTVSEYQKNGRIHFHSIFFDLMYIPNEKLREIWGKGFVKINKIDIDDETNIGLYLSKYFVKDFDIKARYKKSYLKSSGLFDPVQEKLHLTNEEQAQLANSPNIAYIGQYKHQYNDTEMKCTYIQIKNDKNILSKRNK